MHWLFTILTLGFIATRICACRHRWHVFSWVCRTNLRFVISVSLLAVCTGVPRTVLEHMSSVTYVGFLPLTTCCLTLLAKLQASKRPINNERMEARKQSVRGLLTQAFSTHNFKEDCSECRHTSRWVITNIDKTWNTTCWQLNNNKMWFLHISNSNRTTFAPQSMTESLHYRISESDHY